MGIVDPNQVHYAYPLKKQTITLQVPSPGRMVFYVLPGCITLRPSAMGEIRPATIVRVWGENDPDAAIQLDVHLDGRNDKEDYDGRLYLATSVRHDEVTKAPGTWHWPPFVPPVIREIEVTSNG